VHDEKIWMGKGSFFSSQFLVHGSQTTAHRFFDHGPGMQKNRPAAFLKAAGLINLSFKLKTNPESRFFTGPTRHRNGGP
jgi:hypothetical protein